MHSKSDVELNLRRHGTSPALPARKFAGVRLKLLLCDLLQGVGKIAAGGWRRKGFAVLMVELDGLFNNLAQLGKDLLFVRAVAPAVQQARCATHKALIFL